MSIWTFQSATEAFNWNFNTTITNGSTLAMAYSKGVNAGDLLLLNLSVDAAYTWVVTDTQGNTWNQINPFLDRGDANLKGSLYWAVAKSFGANTVNALNTSGVSGTSIAWEIASFTPPLGQIVLDKTATATGNSTTPQVAVSTTKVVDLVIGAIVPFGGATSVLAGFTATNSFGGNNNPMVYATEISSGSYSPGVNHPSNIWGAIGATFSTASSIPIQKKRKSAVAAATPMFTGRMYDYFITLEKLWPLS